MSDRLTLPGRDPLRVVRRATEAGASVTALLEPAPARPRREIGLAPAAASAGEPLSVTVVFATRGRPDVLAKSLGALSRQTLPPAGIIVSAVSPEDLGSVRAVGNVECLLGSTGLARQRNAALRHLGPNTDVVVFFDDDFLPHPRWLEAVERCFRERPGVVAITGHVIADGISGPGLSFAEASDLISRSVERSYIMRDFSPYGCNMAFRRSSIGDLYFDEKLVLYGWLEDRDFGGALRKRGGELIKLGAAAGVHLGVKSGRVSGRRLGYSQIANPIYLHRKGTMTTRSLVAHLFRNVSSNLLKAAVPERHVDRLGRLVGNIVAFRDLMAGVSSPERAELH